MQGIANPIRARETLAETDVATVNFQILHTAGEELRGNARHCAENAFDIAEMTNLSQVAAGLSPPTALGVYQFSSVS